MFTYNYIYKRDTKGNLRVWFMEQDSARYRTTAGIDGGALVTAEWTEAKPTNVGRANERDAVAQAAFEIWAAYEHKLTREYHETIEACEGGAHYFKPMLAQEFTPDKFAPGFAQPKLDGMRCIATADGLFSRQGKPINSCPHIEEALKPLFDSNPDLILDGELYNHDLKDDFGKLMSMVKKASPTPEQAKTISETIEYHVYDCPSAKGDFRNRVNAMVTTFAAHRMISRGGDGVVHQPTPIKTVATKALDTLEAFDEFHIGCIANGYEGSIYRLNKDYDQKRSKSLLKRKDFDDAEFEVVEIQEGEGNWSGAAKRVICWLPDADKSAGHNKSNTFEAGIRGTYDRGVELLTEKHHIVTIRFFGLTDTAIPKPRFGVATKFHGEGRTL